MANGIAVQDAAKLFAQEDGFCIGLHCTLHAEWDRVRWGPVLSPKQVPSLVLEDGTFHRSPADWKTSGFEISEVMAELQAQLEAVRKLGFKPYYADTHMGFERIDERLTHLFDNWCESEGLMSYRNVCMNISYNRTGQRKDPVLNVIQALESVPSGIYRLVTHPTFMDEEILNFGNAQHTGEHIARRETPTADCSKTNDSSGILPRTEFAPFVTTSSGNIANRIKTQLITFKL